MIRSMAFLFAWLLLTAAAAGGEAAGKKNSDSGGRFALELDGVNTGFLKNVDGGAIGARLAGGGSGADAARAKQITGPAYEDFILTVPIYAPQPVADWIQKDWSGEPSRASGRIIAVDNFLGATGERAFTGAVITETIVPACDVAGKDQAYLTVKFRPDSIRYKKGDGAEVSVPPKAKKKKWVPANFRLRIKGLDTSRVVKIDSFTITHTHRLPGAPDAGGGPGAAEFPNLSITIDEDSADSWIKWHDDFAVKGNNSADKEKSGTLEFLDVDRKSTLLTIQLKGLGVFAFLPDTREPGDDQIHQACFDLYTKGMSLDLSRKSD